MSATRSAMLAAAAVLLLLVWQPACDLSSAHAATPGDPAACCAVLAHMDGPEGAGIGAPAPDTPPVAASAPAWYFAAALPVMPRVRPAASAALHTLSFYARSVRMLR